MTWQTLLVGVGGILPSLIQTIELMFPSKPGQPKQGPTKLGAVIGIAQNFLTIAAAAGVIPVADAQNISAIADLTQATVLDLKGQGKIGGNPTPQVPVQDHTTPIQNSAVQLTAPALKPAPTAVSSPAAVPVKPPINLGKLVK